MTRTTLARGSSVVLFAPSLFVPLLLLAAGCATNIPRQTNANVVATPAPTQIGPSAGSFDPQLIVAGRLDCKTNEVEVTDGVLERGRFENDDALSAMLADKGYGRAALAELKELKVCSLDEDYLKRLRQPGHGEVATADSRPSLLLKVALKAPYVLFSLSEFDFSGSGYDTLSAFLAAEEEQKACERINEKCVVCPDQIIYCVKPKK